MGKFKEGDYVVCVDDLYYNLTINKIYKVLKRHMDDDRHSTIWVRNDKGQESYYHTSLFISIMENRTNTINDILDYD